MKKFLTDRNLHLLLIILSFFVWIFCFKGFVFNQLSLESDAIAYYEHFQYFTDNISRGVYPFWEAGRIKGIPAEFFMRRIGSFNPLFGYIVIQSFFEIPFRFTYLSFLALYYFLGVVGFYLLALRIFQNKTVALVTYLLFMFSSIGTRMFDSYFLLVVIPMIWFFYFLVSFACHQKRHLFIGIIFTLMILATTYVPFFFINILLTFILCYSIFYLKESGRFLQNSFRFVIKNKIFTGLCTICLGVSLMPGILLWQDAGGGLVDKKGPEFALTQRNASGEAENAISVGLETITSWGIEEDILYAVSFEDMRTFKFAILYIPVFAYIILFLGLACRIRKRLLFFFVWGFGTLLIFAHRAPF
ncbi:MAG: hypothetical protein KC618_03455, partial [Candidatus Omnitrophica bacterium]|nr:hypothetical protein [Candidatus Omnitrophota bacterium]